MTPRRRRGRPPSLTSATVTEVMRLYFDGVSVRTIAKRLGIGKSTVGRLVVQLDRPANPSNKPTTAPEGQPR